MSLKKEMNLNDYLNVIKRKLTVVIIFFVISFVITVSYALYLPPVYESTGTILIKSQQVQAGDPNKKFATERFESLKQVVLSNESLMGLVRKYQLFDLTAEAKLTSETEATFSNIMRNKIKAELVQVDSGNWGTKDTIAFKVTANLNKPDQTYHVAKDVVEMFLAENLSSTNSKVQENADFFEKEASDKKKYLEAIENQISDFKRTHANSLPQSVAVQATSLDRLDADLRAAQREQSLAESEMRSLEISLDSAKSGADIDVGFSGPVAESELDRLKNELVKQSAIYNDNHPSIIALSRKIKALDEKEKDNIVPDKPKVSKSQATVISRLEGQLLAAKSRIKAIDREQSEIRNKMERTQSLVIQGAQSEGVLGALERKYESAIEEYTVAKTKFDNAKREQDIQLENKGEHFDLLEAPILPETPIKPNRILLIVLGFIASLVGAAGVAIMIEALDGKVRGVDGIAELVKLQPMATIPYIKNDIDEVQVKYEYYNIAYFVFSVIVLILIIVHFFVMPLDEMASKMYGGI